MKIERLAMFLASTVLLAACVAPPTRNSDPGQFKSLMSGTIPAASVNAFADCLLDGFDKAHFILTNTQARQQRRSDGFRVETTTGNSILVSADVMDNGKVELLEGSSASLVNTSGERGAFASCLAKFSVRS